MELTIKIPTTVDFNILHVKAGVRYWEDATVDGVEDTNGDLIPCREGDYWSPFIDLDRGVILNWELGKSADIHYKICDNGSYILIGIINELTPIKMTLEDSYVLDFLADGDDDYIVMKIDSQGNILNWNPKIIQKQILSYDWSIIK